MPEARKKYGYNRLDYKKENGFFDAIKNLAKEPMVILLLMAFYIYFIIGDTGDGIFLAAAIVLVSGISLYQDSGSHNALEKLKNFTQPNCKVIRCESLTVYKDQSTEDNLIYQGTTVICTDKTGTITENKISLVKLFVLASQKKPDAETHYGMMKKRSSYLAHRARLS